MSHQNNALAVAYAIRKRNQMKREESKVDSEESMPPMAHEDKMSKGMDSEDASSLAKAVMAHLCGGGIASAMSEGGMVSENHDEFLSGAGDDDDDGETEDFAEGGMAGSKMSEMMKRIRVRHMK